MFRRSVLLLVGVFVFAAGCSATPDTPERGQLDGATESLQQLPMPEQTRAVVHVTPDGADELSQLYSTADEEGRAPESDDQTVSPATRLVGWWLAHAGEAVVPPRDWMDGIDYDESLAEHGSFAGIDESRPIVVAVTTRGARASARYLRYRTVPVVYDAVVSRGALRVFVPAEEPIRLRRELRDYCEGTSPACRFVERFDVHGGYMVVDLHRSQWLTGEALDLQRVSAPALDGTDPGYWEASTPAMGAFLDGDHDLAVYIRTRDIPLWGALAQTTEVVDALQMATPRNRARMFGRGMEISGQILKLSSPEVREYEDVALTVEADGRDRSATVDVVRSFTEHGAEISEPTPEMEGASRERDTDSVVDFAWSADGGAVGSELRRPGWATPFDELAGKDRPVVELPRSDMSDPLDVDFGPDAIYELFRNGGIPAYLTVMAGYPRANHRVVQDLIDPDGPVFGPVRSVQLQISRQNARRVADRLRDDELWQGSASLTRLQILGELLDFFAIRVPGGSEGRQWEEFARQVTSAVFRQLDVDLELHVEPGDDETLIALLPEEATVDRIPDPVADGAAHLDIETDAIPEPVRTELKEMAGLDHPAIPLSADPGPTRVRHAVFETGSATRARFGTGADVEPHKPSTDYEPRPVDVPPDCLRMARWLSPDFQDLAEMPGRERVSVAAEVRGVVEKLRSDCENDEAARDELDWITDRWRVVEAVALAGDRRWEESVELFDAACSGFAPACLDGQRLGSKSEAMQLPRVERADGSVSAARGGPAFVGDDVAAWAPMFWHGSLLRAAGIDDRVDEANLYFQHFENDDDLRTLEWPETTSAWTVDIDTTDDRSGGARYPVVRAPVGRGMSVRRLQAFFQNVQDQSIESQHRIPEYVDDYPLPDRAPLVATIVEADQTADSPNPEKEAVLLWGAEQHLDKTQRRPVQLRWTEEGIFIRSGDGRVEPLEGCPDDGPTICVDGDISTPLEGWGDDGGDDVFERFEDRFRFDRLAEALEAVAGVSDQPGESPAPVFVIEAVGDVPFGGLARLHAELGAWTEREFEVKPLVVVK